MKRYSKIIIYSSILLFQSCGTLGSFEIIHFNCSKPELTAAIDSLYKYYPDYGSPKKWEKYDDWTERGYDFLDSRIFYLKIVPEEMYYVTFIGDSLEQTSKSHINMSIRAVSRGDFKWLLRTDFSNKEIQRIQTRFENEIVAKLGFQYFKSD